jgi:hypothetical protein
VECLTTANGDFSLPDIPVMARYKLRVTGIGYQTYEQNVNFEMPRNGAGVAILLPCYQHLIKI